jgi:hypothetical protein
MGCFGYICKGCGTPINGDCFIGGEKCMLIHVRHGEEIGRVEGHYDEYGRVIEQEGLPEAERYRGDDSGPNGHEAICKSEFGLADSLCLLQSSRIYKGQELSFFQFAVAKSLEAGVVLDVNPFSHAEYECEFNALPIPKRAHYSGTAAWHSLCYHRATTEERNDLTPSDSDPNQSCGRIRKKYK